MKKLVYIMVVVSVIILLSACAKTTTNGKGTNSNAIKSMIDTTDVQLSPYLVRAKDSENSLFGYVDVRTGEYVIEPQFKDCDESFGDDGWAEVCNESNDESVINTSGDLLFAYEDIEGVRAYEGNCIVVYTLDERHAFLYHGAEFVCELEVPVDEYDSLYPSGANWANDYKSGVSYNPERYIVLTIITDDDALKAWYDESGQLIFVTKYSYDGCLAGDETGYYYIRTNFIDVIDFDGNITKTISREDEDYCGVVEWDGNNWYTIITINGSTGIYTNGLTKLCETIGQEKYSRDYWDNIDVDCGVIRTLDGSCIKTDGTMFFQGLSYRIGSNARIFRNGYAKAESNCLTAYMDTEGNPVLDIPDDHWDEYSDVLKDGYFVYGEGGLLGIKKIDGSIVVEPKYQSLYTIEK